MRGNCSTGKTYLEKTAPRIVDAVRINNRYFDIETVKEKAAGIISISMILAFLAAFSFLFFI